MLDGTTSIILRYPYVFFLDILMRFLKISLCVL